MRRPTSSLSDAAWLAAALTLAGTVTHCGRKQSGAPGTAASSSSSAAPAHPSGSAPARSASATSRFDPAFDAHPQFEGKVTLRLAGGGIVSLAQARQGKTRVELHRLPRGAQQDYGAIANWSKRELSLLLHRQHTYAQMSFEELGLSASSLGAWRFSDEGKKDIVAGRSCELGELTDGAFRVSVCLARGPLQLDARAIERAAGIELPEWAERWMSQGYLPLRVRVRDAGGRTFFAEEVADWQEGPVTDAEFDVPSDYRPVGRQKQSRAGPRKRR